jgi:hypothetical protein
MLVKQKVNHQKKRKEITENFQIVNYNLNEITIRYVKFKSQLDFNLEEKLKLIDQNKRGSKNSGLSKSAVEGTSSEGHIVRAKVTDVQVEANKFLGSIFDLMDIFFNPKYNGNSQLDENGLPNNSILKDFHQGSLVLNGQLVSPVMKRQKSIVLIMFTIMAFILIISMISIFVIKIKSRKNL